MGISRGTRPTKAMGSPKTIESVSTRLWSPATGEFRSRSSSRTTTHRLPYFVTSLSSDIPRLRGTSFIFSRFFYNYFLGIRFTQSSSSHPPPLTRVYLLNSLRQDPLFLRGSWKFIFTMISFCPRSEEWWVLPSMSVFVPLLSSPGHHNFP